MTATSPAVISKPMLFSGPMVLRLLDGSKTQTRRVLLKSPEHNERYEFRGWRHDPDRAAFDLKKPRKGLPLLIPSFGVNCPHPVGSIAWVKETYRTVHDPGTCREGALDIDYAADGTERIMDHYKTPGRIKWKPSIFMPRWASRIDLEITGVRVEGLNSISTLDAIAEGIPQTWGEWGGNAPEWAVRSIGKEFGSPGTHLWDNRTSVENFKLLWDSLNGKTFPWESNPYVFVYEFRRIKP